MEQDSRELASVRLLHGAYSTAAAASASMTSKELKLQPCGPLDAAEMCVIAIAWNLPAVDYPSRLRQAANSFVRWCTICFLAFPVTSLIRAPARFAIISPR